MVVQQPPALSPAPDAGPVLASVVMPVFRESPARLSRAVESVLKQTHSHLELLLISDDQDSTTPSPVDQLLSDPRVRRLSTGQVGAGPSVARNVGLAAARGDVVAFLDSDDFLELDKLEVMAPLAREHGVAIDNTRFGYENSTRIGTYYQGDAFGFQPFTFFSEIDWPLAAVYDRHRHGLLRFDEGVSFSEDALFNYSLLLLNGGGFFINRPLHNYVIRPVSMSHGPDAGARADASYGAILHNLATHDAHPALIAAFERKRQVNRSYLRWLSGVGGTFHDFICAGPSIVEKPEPEVAL